MIDKSIRAFLKLRLVDVKRKYNYFKTNLISSSSIVLEHHTKFYPVKSKVKRLSGLGRLMWPILLKRFKTLVKCEITRHVTSRVMRYLS